MKYFFSIIFLIITIFPSNLPGQEKKDIVQFYPAADSICDYPALYETLVIVCQKKIDSLFVTFIGSKSQKRIFIGAITKKPIRNPDKEISRIVDIDGIKPLLGKVSTWGYIFDRNNDGKIDYMALVGGAAAFKDEKITQNFPRRNQKFNKEQFKLFISHCKLIFNHWVDDNYDGKLDAVVHIDMDPERDWVERKIIARSTKFDGRFDDVWAFRKDINIEHNPVNSTAAAVPFYPLGSGQGAITKKMLLEKTDYLQLFNRAAAECNIGKNGFLGE